MLGLLFLVPNTARHLLPAMKQASSGTRRISFTLWQRHQAHGTSLPPAPACLPLRRISSTLWQRHQVHLLTALSCCLHHVAQGRQGLGPPACLEPAVRVDPQTLRVARHHTRGKEGSAMTRWMKCVDEEGGLLPTGLQQAVTSMQGVTCTQNTQECLPWECPVV